MGPWGSSASQVRYSGVSASNVQRAALLATTTWLLFQLWFALGYNYSFGGNPSSQILAGGYFMTWVRSLGPLRAAESLVLHLGPLSFLAAVGFRRAPAALKRLAEFSR